MNTKILRDSLLFFVIYVLLPESEVFKLLYCQNKRRQRDKTTKVLLPLGSCDGIIQCWLILWFFDYSKEYQR